MATINSVVQSLERLNPTKHSADQEEKTVERADEIFGGFKL